MVDVSCPSTISVAGLKLINDQERYRPTLDAENETAARHQDVEESAYRKGEGGIGDGVVVCMMIPLEFKGRLAC